MASASWLSHAMQLRVLCMSGKSKRGSPLMSVGRAEDRLGLQAFERTKITYRFSS